MQNEASMLIFKCGWYDLLNSKMISHGGYFYVMKDKLNMEDIYFKCLSNVFSLSSIVLP